MNFQNSMNTEEAVLTTCLMAAFADGGKSEVERAEFKRITDGLASPDLDTARLYQDVLLKRTSLERVASALTTPESRNLAYEMAVCVCDADDTLHDGEKRFLADLRRALSLDDAATAGIEQHAEALTVAAVPSGPPPIPAVAKTPPVTDVKPTDPAADQMILNYAILNGALELLPESLATMAIVPLQMKMVYRIGKQHGHELSRGHIAELLGAAGIGLTSQVVEGYARKLLGGLLGKMGGSLARKMGNQLASSAMSFATTYALGNLAQRYYAGGRTLSGMQLRELFSSLQADARTLHSRYTGEIQQKARTINPSQILGLVKGS